MSKPPARKPAKRKATKPKPNTRSKAKRKATKPKPTARPSRGTTTPATTARRTKPKATETKATETKAHDGMSADVVAPDATPLPSASPASFGQRLAAFVLDIIALAVLQGVVLGVANVATGSALPVDIGPDDSAFGLSNLITLVLVVALPMAIAMLYYGVLQSGMRGQSLGQRAVKIRIATLDGDPVGFWRAALRFPARTLSALPLLWGYFAMLRSPAGQTWHDHLARTVVLSTTTRLQPRPGARGWSTVSLVALPLTAALLLWALVGAIVGSHDPDRRPLAALEAGDCVIDPGYRHATFDYEWLRVVECEDLHDSEVLGTFENTEGWFSENDLLAAASTECVARYTDYLGVHPAEGLFPLDFVFPSQEQWEDGHRTTVCLVTDPSGYLQGSLEDSLGGRARPGTGSVG